MPNHPPVLVAVQAVQVREVPVQGPSARVPRPSHAPSQVGAGVPVRVSPSTTSAEPVAAASSGAAFLMVLLGSARAAGLCVVTLVCGHRQATRPPLRTARSARQATPS